MSLDFMVFAPDQSAYEVVPIGVDLHHKLIAEAISRGLEKFLQFDDYYSDVEIPVVELSSLADEVAAFRASSCPAELANFIRDLNQLVVQAISLKQPLLAVAD